MCIGVYWSMTSFRTDLVGNGLWWGTGRDPRLINYNVISGLGIVFFKVWSVDLELDHPLISLNLHTIGSTVVAWCTCLNFSIENCTKSTFMSRSTVSFTLLFGNHDSPSARVDT